MPLRTLLKICTTVMLLLCTSLVASVPVRAATINITYSLTGMGTVTGMTSTSLDLTGAFTGSVDQANTAENAVWNPVTYNDVSQANLSTGLLNGTFSITFANGEMLSGMVGENVSAIISSPTGTGPFTQMLTSQREPASSPALVGLPPARVLSGRLRVRCPEPEP